MKLTLLCAALLSIGAVSASAGIISLTNSTTGNFDASSGTRAVTFTGSEAGFGTGTISNVRISINFAKADGELFDPPFPGGTPFFNEIHFRLTGPSATPVELIAAGSWGGGTGQFDGIITFDDAAGAVVNFGAAPVAGTFRPTGAGALADFNGQNALGIWTLFIEDTAGSDSLRFRSFTLDISTDGAVIPEPASMALVGLGLCAAAFIRRRKSRT